MRSNSSKRSGHDTDIYCISERRERWRETIYSFRHCANGHRALSNLGLFRHAADDGLSEKGVAPLAHILNDEGEDDWVSVSVPWCFGSRSRKVAGASGRK